MLDEDFQILSRTELDVELSHLFRRWDATAQERAEFVGWAWVVAAAADMSAIESRATASAMLRQERDLAHRLLAENLHSNSTIDLYLVSKRMFLDWLAGELLHERAAA